MRKPIIRKKPALYDLQQIALQQKRNAVEGEEEEEGIEFYDENTDIATRGATRSFSIDDIFFTNEIERQQLQQESIKRTTSVKAELNPFCDKNNSIFNMKNNLNAYFSDDDDNDADDIFNHSQVHQNNNRKYTIEKTKFTPLAMAAHATAMAVLENNYHFNKDNKTINFFEQTQKNHKNIFNVQNDDDDDDWSNNGGGFEWHSYASNEKEKYNNNVVNFEQQQQQVPSKIEYIENADDVYSTTWCTNQINGLQNITTTYNSTPSTLKADQIKIKTYT